METQGRICEKGETSQKNAIALVCLDLRRRESRCERWRGWRWRLHHPIRPLILRDILGYRVCGGIERTARAPPIPSIPARPATGRRVIGVHVWIVATSTGCSGVIVLGSFAFLLANTMYARARVHRVVDSPVRTFAPVRQRPGHLFEAWVQGEVVTNRVLEDKQN